MIIKTKLKDLYLIKNKTFHDERGYFKELIRENIIKKKFPFHVMSYSKKNVLRGLHIQTKNSQAKFVTVVKGKIFDVAVDLRKKSKTYKKYLSFKISSSNRSGVIVPKGCAHGFQTLKSNTEVVYFTTEYYNKSKETGLNFLDPSIKIKWPLKVTEISKKDFHLKKLVK